MTGTIEKFGRNSIDILDEDDDRSKRLVCFSIKDRFHLGERVRVRYDLRTLLVESMQRMTPVEYKKDGQNAGYLFLAEAEGSSQ